MDDNLFGEFTAYHKISYAKKKAGNYKWIEDNCNYIDNLNEDNYTEEELLRMRVNYFIANAQGSSAMELKAKHRNLGNLRNQKTPYPESNDVKYYDIIRRVLVRMWGEQQKRKLKPIAYDTSKYNTNIRKKKRLELHQQYIQENIVQPIIQQAQMEVMTKHNIQDPLQLNPEQQQQIQSEIDSIIKFKTPSDIEKYMSSEYKSHSETQLQALTDWLLKEYDLKFNCDEAYKDLTIAGFNAAEIDIKNNRPWTQIINPLNFRYLNNPDSVFIEDSEWWVHEKHVTMSTFINDYLSDENELKRFYKTHSKNNTDSNGAYRRFIRGEINPKITLGLANEVIAPSGMIDTKTGQTSYGLPDVSSEDGQTFYKMLHAMYGSREEYNTNTLRVARIVFSSLDMVQYVERINPKTNRLQGFYVGENYESNPDIDYKVTKMWAKALYECHKAGYANEFIFNKKRVPFQNRSINDPFKVYAPFIGVEYSKLHNNSKRISTVDLGQPFNYEYNIVKNQIEKLEEQNMGKIFLFPDKAVPYNWDFEDYVDKIKRTKLAPISLDEIEYVQLVANLFKGIDLSVDNDIGNKLIRLQNIEQECQQAMNYSPSSMGQAAASMTATNNQQNIIQNSYAMEDIVSLQRKFEERYLYYFANLTRNALRDNEELKSYLLDDLSIAELDLSPEVLNYSELAIKLVNDTEEIRGITSFKNLLQPLIQNGLIDISTAIKIQFSDNPADLINIAEQAEKLRQRKEEEMMKQQQMQQEKQLEMLQADKQNEEKWKQLNFELDELKVKLDYEKAKLGVQEWEVSKDINRNQIADTTEENREKIASAERIAKMNIESDEKQNKEKLEVEKLKIASNNNKTTKTK